jgi:hypothetical protein
MSELWKKIAAAIARLQKKPVQAEGNRRQVPRLICCRAVVWECGCQRGEAELREVSTTGMRLRTDQALLAGRHIRIRPLASGVEPPLPLDMVFGTVIYSKCRKGKVDVGVELSSPERLSRFAWFHQLRCEGKQKAVSPMASILPSKASLHLVGKAPDGLKKRN